MKIYLHGGEGRKLQFFLGGQITKFSRPEFKGQKDLLFFQAIGIHCCTKIIFPLKNLFICTSICNDCDSYRHNHEILIFDFFLEAMIDSNIFHKNKGKKYFFLSAPTF